MKAFQYERHMFAFFRLSRAASTLLHNAISMQDSVQIPSRKCVLGTFPVPAFEALALVQFVILAIRTRQFDSKKICFPMRAILAVLEYTLTVRVQYKLVLADRLRGI